MRVVLVIDYALDYLGGAQSAFLDEARALDAHGHDVLIIAPAGRRTSAGLPDRVRALEIPARTTLPIVDLPVLRSTAALRTRLDAAFRAHAADVVHVHSEFGLAAAAVAAARDRGIRTVQTVHTFFWTARVPRAFAPLGARAVSGLARALRGYGSGPRGLAAAPVDDALRGVTRSLAEHVDVVVSPSAHQAAHLRAAGLPRVEVLPNAAAFDSPAGSPLESIGTPLRVAWVGRFAREKRPLEFIRAVAMAAERLGPDRIEAELVGEGPLLPAARRLAERLAAPVRFAGRLPRAAVQERLRAAHLSAVTSHGFDNQPVVIVESLHARRGVIVVDPALTEGLEEAGLRPADASTAALAALLVDLVGDPDRVVAASRAAEAGAREFDPGRHVARLERLYRP